MATRGLSLLLLRLCIVACAAVSLPGARSTNCQCSCPATTFPPPPPPPPPSPQAPAAAVTPANPFPCSFDNIRQYQAYIVIQRFKLNVTCDPLNVTRSWTGTQPCSTYEGLAYCEAPPDSPRTTTIAAVDFNGFGLCSPTLTGFIDQLPDIAIFHANSNNFSGTVPNLSGLQYLYELDFSNNNLSGPFPATLLPLANLTFLDLRYNRFSGALPPEVFFLGVEVLFLNNNRFNGSLPATLGSTTAAYLTLANNAFSGTIPRSIGNASATLLEVLFLNNKLCGCLPYEIGLLANATVFDAGQNQITGQIPLSFGCLRKLEQLNLAGNLLYGEVPDAVCSLAADGSLVNLSLSGNFFTTLGHTCWRLLKKKPDVIDVRNNCIRGLHNQRSKEECSWFSHQYKHCPVSKHVPCSFPMCPLTPPPPPTPPAKKHRPGLEESYASYSMLHRPPPHN